MVRWMCDRRVVLGIRVPKVYNFIFLLVLSVEMTPKTKYRKGKRSKKENVDQSQGGRTVKVRSPWVCRKVTALYPCDFKGNARAPRGNLAITAPVPYDYPKSLQSCTIFCFCPNDSFKSCVVRKISARPLCGGRAMLPTTCLRACDIYFF